MAKLGTSKHPAIVRVRTEERADEILALCDQHGWQVIVGVEPENEEDVSDVERLLRPPTPARAAEPSPGRNDPCRCGSGRKYKRCCGANTRASRA